MKKLIILTTLLVGMAAGLNAQSRAIGARIGGNVEFSYQHQLGGNMLDCSAGLGFGYHHFGINATVMYDWVFPINSWNHSGAWNWYVGPGGGLGVLIATQNNNLSIPVALNIGGQIGIEYQFEFPLNLSLDYRPMINVLGFGDSTWSNLYGIALGVRYRFN